MLDVTILYKLGAIGLIMIVIEQIMVSAKKQEVAMLINFIGILIIVGYVAYKLSDLFGKVQMLFKF